LLQNPSWNWQTATYEQFDRWFAQSVHEYRNVIATDNRNLEPFREAGSKIVIWHGWADQLIFPLGTVNYYQRVQEALGGAGTTDTFARLFMAPGVAHCGGGPGPAPAEPFGAVVNWVEHHQGPRTLVATRVDATATWFRPDRSACIR
jgi:tannase/feruloyl esterase